MIASGRAKAQPEIALEPRDERPLATNAASAMAREWFLKRLRLLWEERRWLSRAVLVGALVGGCLAFALPKRYEASTQLMPPDNQSTSAMGLLAGLRESAADAGRTARVLRRLR